MLNGPHEYIFSALKITEKAFSLVTACAKDPGTLAEPLSNKKPPPPPIKKKKKPELVAGFDLNLADGRKAN